MKPQYTGRMPRPGIRKGDLVEVLAPEGTLAQVDPRDIPTIDARSAEMLKANTVGHPDFFFIKVSKPLRVLDTYDIQPGLWSPAGYGRWCKLDMTTENGETVWVFEWQLRKVEEKRNLLLRILGNHNFIYLVVLYAMVHNYLHC